MNDFLFTLLPWCAVALFVWGVWKVATVARRGGSLKAPVLIFAASSTAAAVLFVYGR